MSDVKTFGANLIWFLSELESAEDYQFETGQIEILGADESGNEGAIEVSVQDLAGAAVSEIVNRDKEITILKSALKEIVDSAIDCDDFDSFPSDVIEMANQALRDSS